MRLKVLLPAEILIDQEVVRIIAEAENGFFCLLPRHIDYVTVLVPGLLSYTASDGNEVFVAIDEGVLVKRGAEVMVSTRNAVVGADLGELRQTIEEQFRMLDEREKLARSALVRLEAGMVRRFIDLER